MDAIRAQEPSIARVPTTQSLAREPAGGAPRVTRDEPTREPSLAINEPATTLFERDPFSATALTEVIDRSLHATVARATFGLSPMSMAGAYFDWAMYLAFSPGKLMQLWTKAARKSYRFQHYTVGCCLAVNGGSPCIEPLPQDKRFAGQQWQQFPFNFIYQNFLLQQQWWHNATTDVRGVTHQHERMVQFGSRQMLDMVSPSNFLLTNPEVLARTLETAGANLLKGQRNFLEDVDRLFSGKPQPDVNRFRPGVDVAVTKGKVVYRNRLIELIQYTPTTDMVRPEPVLIVPAWIMKYYILDLSPANSLVRHLVDQGFTVFMISWKNPEPQDRDLSLEDYRQSGIEAAIEAIGEIVPNQKVHAAGYCLGGTLLTIAAAAMARYRRDRLATVTLLAAQADFTEAGELTLFVNEAQISFLEDLMWEQGFLDASQMAGAFSLLRSADLIWSKRVREYLLGVREPINDLMAWNADGTRLSYQMHSDYLHKLFLDNDLAEGRYTVGGRPISIGDIHAPMFLVSTEYDHVAPWRSVYKLHLFADSDITFVLTNGGHNAGIVSEPGHAGRRYRIATKLEADTYLDPETWLAAHQPQAGSWWPEWWRWLGERSGPPVRPAFKAQPFVAYDAPGAYVLER